jgi:hypothetical protein
MPSARTRRTLRLGVIVAASLVVAGALTVAVTVWVAGAGNTAEELSRRLLVVETAMWPLMARVAGPFSSGPSGAEREVWRTVIELNATGPGNRRMPAGVDPIAIWPAQEREPLRELRARIVDGWVRGPRGTPAASAAVDHFVLQNERTAFVNCHELPELVTCIPRAAFERHVREFDGWSAFAQENKDIREYMRVSRVGFNARHSLAVVYAELSCGVLCGGGGYFVFSRHEGKWHLAAYYEKWVS